MARSCVDSGSCPAGGVKKGKKKEEKEGEEKARFAFCAKGFATIILKQWLDSARDLSGAVSDEFAPHTKQFSSSSPGFPSHALASTFTDKDEEGRILDVLCAECLLVLAPLQGG